MKIEKNAQKSFFWPFCSFSEGKKWTLEILMKIEKIAQKSFFWPFCSFSEGEKWTLEILIKIEKTPKKIIFVFRFSAAFGNFDGSV